MTLPVTSVLTPSTTLIHLEPIRWSILCDDFREALRGGHPLVPDHDDDAHESEPRHCLEPCSGSPRVARHAFASQRFDMSLVETAELTLLLAVAGAPHRTIASRIACVNSVKIGPCQAIQIPISPVTAPT